MVQSHKLSLFSAILINVNIMLGSGVFINTVILAQKTASLSPLTYAIVGLLLLPLILGMSQLLNCNLKGGTFYHFGQAVNPFLGFLSSWSYFVAKLGSFTLSIHVCVSLMQQLIPFLQNISTLGLDALIIMSFVVLNTLNMKMGQSIQYAFIVFKLVPIIFTVCAGLFLFDPGYFSVSYHDVTGIAPAIPFVLFAFIGFEASCSLSQSIENPEKNTSKAIIMSYCIVVGTVIIYQFMFYGALGSGLSALNNYLQAFPSLIGETTQIESFRAILMGLCNIGIASSALGASYGMMFSNSWNLYTLSQHKHTFLSSTLSSFNAHNIPVYCVIAEGLLALVYLFISKGHQVSLQQVGALGSTIAYSCSALALLCIALRNKSHSKVIPVLSLASCAILAGSFAWNIMTQGVTTLVLFFVGLLLFGIGMYYTTYKEHIKQSS
jgi:amino acid transporter